MAATLLATQVPIPIVNTTLDKLSVAENAAGTGGADVLRKLVQGATTMAAYWNRNAQTIELIGRWGCGTYCVINGLTLGTGSGLNLAVAAGQALLDGVVEISADTTYTVPANQSRVYIWFKQDGTLTHTLTTTPPASTPMVFIGSCVTGASSISSVDTSGIMTSMGAIAQRETADTGTPGDAPSSAVAFLTKTTNGVYLWNGTAYQLMYTTAQYQELIQDTVGAMVTTSTGVTWTYNDTAGTLAMNFDLTAFNTDSLPEGADQLYVTTITRKHLKWPTNAETLTADKTLTTNSHNVQALQASGADRNVRLPSNTGITFGHWFKIMHVGTTNNIVVKSNDGATAIVTLGTATYASIGPISSSGTAIWPSTGTTSPIA